MIRNWPLYWICALTVLVGACKDKANEHAISASKPVVNVPDPAAGLPVAGNLGEQLQVEAASRPKDTPTAEAVIEALGKAGIVVTNTKQFMGRTALANYCFGGITGLTTSVTVCEYSSPEAAMGGIEHLLKVVAIPNRKLTQNKRTVLTLARGVDSDEAKAEVEKAIEVFTKL